MEENKGIRGNTHKCSLCNKQFYIPIDCCRWTYRQQNDLFCSYTCKRKFQLDPGKHQKGKSKKAESDFKPFSAEHFAKLETVGDRLSYLRSLKKLTLNDVAKSLFISKSIIHCYEKNKLKKPSIDMLKKLADFYGISIKTLLG